MGEPIIKTKEHSCSRKIRPNLFLRISGKRHLKLFLTGWGLLTVHRVPENGEVALESCGNCCF